MPTHIPKSTVHPLLEHCLLLDDEVKAELSLQMKNMSDSDAASMQTLIRTLDTDALTSLRELNQLP